MKKNMVKLLGIERGDWIGARFNGELIPLKTRSQKILFEVKNLLSFGAVMSQVKKSVTYTFLTFLLELSNPLNRKNLKELIKRKRSMVNRLLEKLEKINGRKWKSALVRGYLLLYELGSFVQERTIKAIEYSVRRSPKKDPLIQTALKGLKKGYPPLLVIHGCSGSYWMRGEDREIVGLFKPFDEEIFAPNNPIGPIYQGPLGHRAVRAGIRVGEMVHREVGAFIIDDYLGFGLVPRTTYAQFSHSVFFNSRFGIASREVKHKMGSFQAYIENVRSLNDITLEEWHLIPEIELQLLIVLDVILGNTDRNTGNILYSADKIIAIDHGLTLPDRNAGLSYWYWSYLEQLKSPIAPSLLELLDNFPYIELQHKLKNCFLEPPVFARMKERIALFRAGIREGMTPELLRRLMSDDNLLLLEDLDGTLDMKAKEIAKDPKSIQEE